MRSMRMGGILLELFTAEGRSPNGIALTDSATFYDFLQREANSKISMYKRLLAEQVQVAQPHLFYSFLPSGLEAFFGG